MTMGRGSEKNRDENKKSKELLAEGRTDWWTDQPTDRDIELKRRVRATKKFNVALLCGICISEFQIWFEYQ